MIFSAFHRDDPDMMFTIVKRDGRYAQVGVSAEELFRAALGNDEYERRVAVAFGDRPADPERPTPAEPPSVRSYVRRLNLRRRDETA